MGGALAQSPVEVPGGPVMVSQTGAPFSLRATSSMRRHCRAGCSGECAKASPVRGHSLMAEYMQAASKAKRSEAKGGTSEGANKIPVLTEVG